jgi:hypothetical protein
LTNKIHIAIKESIAESNGALNEKITD